MTIEIAADQHAYAAVFEPAEEGGFIVTFPALPGLVTEGDTLEEARAMASGALRGYLEGLAMEGVAPPVDQNTHQIARIKLALDDARSGRPGIPHEAVEAWMESWDTNHELPRPAPQKPTT